jgi:ATP-dependent helicase HrpB
MSATFPIDELLPQIRQTLQQHTRLILEAPPGAGKTTRLPPALLGEAWLDTQRIVMLEPRRIAARSAAMFMASGLGEEVGERVGYRIRFESRVSARTRIEVVTEGILTRLIQDDPGLDGIGALLFDEFHERHLSADLGLALALDVQNQLRPDLRILVMSATLDGERLAQQLDAPRLSSAGRSYPVRVIHPARQGNEPEEAQLKRTVELALRENAGDVLVFLPGLREIQRAESLLSTLADSGEAELLTLHGELPVEQQASVMRAGEHGRRIVLATNVAESSVTLPGVRAVVDTGLAREPRFEPNSGFSRLTTVSISQASADQRAGRAGRVAPGTCYRLWPESQRLEPARRPELMQVELSGLRLELAAWGSTALPFVDPPPAGAMAQAEDLLQALGALDGSRSLTALGRRMLSLGTHPRLAAMLCAARDDTQRAVACDLLALIESRDPLRGEGRRREDWGSRWQALQDSRQRRSLPELDRAALAAIDQAAKQWRRRMGLREQKEDASPHQLGEVLLHAFPDRIAHVLPNDRLRYALSNGRMARLNPDSPLVGELWLVISELRADTGDGLILRATGVDESALQSAFPERFRDVDEAGWDEDTRAVTAARVRRFEQIVLSRKPIGKPDASLCVNGLLAGIRRLGLQALEFSEAQQQWRLRVALLRQHCPELALPDLSDSALLATLEDWLASFIAGKTRLAQIDAALLGEALRARLDHAQRQALERLMPTRIRVPSGMEREIDYLPDHSPVLAVKLQELFGLADTPSIADGRITLTLHLLSPGGRPIQVTRDLRGFWERTYAEVKKELKGRYPKHPWPDDPWTAQATHRAKPRGT